MQRAGTQEEQSTLLRALLRVLLPRLLLFLRL